ncbi:MULTISPECIES: LacI family DNA-binding transcriptional regulator [unclassified Undibacterium]|uniref:LacI family DNA-binding transcriptional regulator n=1 Tax=unclassified Undibacterium TaxID=2630295 RepID=UPI002AC970F5|nr:MULTISPECIES: LacI family DNA-binding transcriptional regulator [unclassified Undibacterium]MEB0140207.1 LacI family DNA-binding transcriptional regulator [Undibacterium sp. CCC2.1]MEB0173254.1 LacI family DNA-binding transcriptional regulator [Undibacterium sp. CCC1.1]MEB0177057.1 LacI family DNA-binding transcriptional regulator [Undibacterium sp. CCC3.4]MEB0216362.1 LacI family DNA-binding transcriptional regulator [Undibacterium sp. 5I2]WPX45215.1 LacI family DNA-binding transcriptional
MDKPVSPKGRASGKTTLADVAAKAGVALMTASRAISQPERVSQALRARVAAAVAELGYVPNRAARSLASAQSNVIVVLVPSLSNAVFTDVLAGVQDALDPYDYQILIGNTRYADAEEEKLLGIYLQSHPDGILLSGLQHSPRVQQMLAASQVPVVSMMDMAIEAQHMSVGFSQFQASLTMTRYLLAKGHTRIGFIGAQLDERTLKRAQAYRQAMSEAGCADPRLELMVSDPSTIALGAELLGRMLAVAPDCTAIFCCNDDLAQGAIYQCQRRGIAVPQQLAICGFNDLPASAWMNPSLTTISTPRYRIGFEAATLLRRAIRQEVPTETHIDLGFTLMARESA